MRITVTAALIAMCLAGTIHQAYAEGATCNGTVTHSKLAGAAKNSFLKKCVTDAQTRCDSMASSKKLAGAARNSFSKKCVADAVGA